MLMRELTILVIGNVIDLGTQAVEDNNPFYFDYRDLMGGIVFPEGGDTTRTINWCCHRGTAMVRVQCINFLFHMAFSGN